MIDADKLQTLSDWIESEAMGDGGLDIDEYLVTRGIAPHDFNVFVMRELEHTFLYTASTGASMVKMLQFAIMHSFFVGMEAARAAPAGRSERDDSIPVGRGTGPYCADCNLDLSLSPEQIAHVRANGNPVPRPPCRFRVNGLHRIGAGQL